MERAHQSIFLWHRNVYWRKLICIRMCVLIKLISLLADLIEQKLFGLFPPPHFIFFSPLHETLKIFVLGSELEQLWKSQELILLINKWVSKPENLWPDASLTLPPTTRQLKIIYLFMLFETGFYYYTAKAGFEFSIPTFAFQLLRL